MKREKTILACGALICFAAALACGVFTVPKAAPAGAVYAGEGPVIVIDPGHGGEDGGAVAADGTPESGINLAISLKTRDIFELFGVETLMTRESDAVNFASGDTIKSRKASEMRGRVEMINSTPGVFLLSVHQNFFTKSKYHGAQVFFSPNDPVGAETAVFIQEYLRVSADPENTRKAAAIADSVYLMKNKKCSGILIECGFLSNPEETEKLKDASYQLTLAKAICAGLMEYYVCK